VPVLHAEKLGAGEIAMRGAAGSGVGVEREKSERDHGVRTGGDKVQGLLGWPIAAWCCEDAARFRADVWEHDQS
jgi:hypothetical protein